MDILLNAAQAAATPASTAEKRAHAHRGRGRISIRSLLSEPCDVTSPTSVAHLLPPIDAQPPAPFALPRTPLPPQALSPPRTFPPHAQPPRTPPHAPQPPPADDSGSTCSGSTSSASSTSSAAGIDKRGGAPRRRWKPHEDALLTLVVRTHGAGRWNRLAEAFPGRNGRQVRLRWVNHLQPSLDKRSWRADEDATLLKWHAALGNKWALIAAHLHGRTDNSVKNRFKSLARRRVAPAQR